MMTFPAHIMFTWSRALLTRCDASRRHCIDCYHKISLRTVRPILLAKSPFGGSSIPSIIETEELLQRPTRVISDGFLYHHRVLGALLVPVSLTRVINLLKTSNGSISNGP